MMKHIVCYSGGHSSALVALEVASRFGISNMVLLNHDMHFTVEHPDIKRFKREVADGIGLQITYANRRGATQDQFDVCVEAKAFKVKNANELCTARLKTEPFMQWLDANASKENSVIYYGFDSSEKARIQRRTGIMGAQGWKTDYPLLWPDRKYTSTDAVGIQRPSSYGVFKHGNCVGCIKARWQHWYIVYCTRPDIWLKAKWAEDEIGHSIHWDDGKQVFLEDMEPRFEKMKAAGVVPTELVPQQRFWADARRVVNISKSMESGDALPCECVL